MGKKSNTKLLPEPNGEESQENGQIQHIMRHAEKRELKIPEEVQTRDA